MAFSEEFFGVADKFLFHRRFKVLLLGICVLPDVRVCFSPKIQEYEIIHLNSSLLNTF